MGKLKYKSTYGAISTGLVSSGHSIGSMLLDSGKLSPGDVESVLYKQKERGIRFGEAALELGLITRGDVEQILSRQFGYPCLQPGENGFSLELSAAYRPYSAHVEALRGLRNQLVLRWFTAGRKMLAIVSPERHEGRSHLAANLAVVFSQLGERTLLIDADLRAPRQHQIFNLQNRQGLSDILAARADISVIERIPSFVDLSVLTAGTLAPNPGELTSRPAFTELLEKVSREYDVILLDTPPGKQISETLTIAARAGGALMLARRDYTRVADLKLLHEQFAGAGVPLAGSVLNQV